MNKSISLLLAITLLSGAILLSNTTSAESSTANASVTVPEACTMTGSGMNSHTATITPGTFSAASGSDYENGIGKTTFTVICNDYNGFSIYAIGYTGDSYDDTNHTKLVGSNTNVAIDTAVYSSGDTSSSWSMKVNKVTDSTISYLPTNMSIQNSFDSWHAIPDTYTKVAQYKANTGSSTTDTTLGAKIDTTYAAFIASNQPGDTYAGQVKYTMVHPYSKGAPSTDDDSTACTTPVPNLTYMQDLTSSNKSSILANMIEDAQYFLKDSRDEKSYCVSKLKDGNIWMTQNLDHNIVSDGSITYDSTTTDLPLGIDWLPERDTYTSYSDVDDNWNSYDRYGDGEGIDGMNQPQSYDPGDLYVDSEAITGMGYYNSCTIEMDCNQTLYNELSNEWLTYFNSCNANYSSCNESLKPSLTSSTGNQHYHLGNYYNWTSAVAMNESSSYYEDGEEVDQSICPAGWTIPKSNEDDLFYDAELGSFRYLIEQYGWSANSGYHLDGYTAHQAPLFYNPSGYLYPTLENIGTDSIQWSSTVYEPDNSYALYYYNASSISLGHAVRSFGISIRCVSR